MRHLIVMLILCGLAGCGTTTVTGPSSERSTVVEYGADGTTPLKRTVLTSGSAGSYVGSKAADANFGGVTLNDAGASVGSSTASVEAADTSNAGLTTLYLIAGVMVAGGLVVGYVTTWPLGLAISGSGLVLIGTVRFLDVYPWALWIPFGLGLASAAYWAYTTYVLRESDRTLGIVVEAIERTDSEAPKKLIPLLAGTKSRKVTDVITKKKRERGLDRVGPPVAPPVPQGVEP